MQQDFLDFLYCAAVAQGAPYMPLQLRRGFQCGQRCDGYQTARLPAYAFSCPDLAPGICRDQFLQGHGEVRCRVERLFDKPIAHYFAPYRQTLLVFLTVFAHSISGFYGLVKD